MRRSARDGQRLPRSTVSMDEALIPATDAHFAMVWSFMSRAFLKASARVSGKPDAHRPVSVPASGSVPANAG